MNIKSINYKKIFITNLKNIFNINLFNLTLFIYYNLIYFDII